MATWKQSQASRLNGSRSKGPVTPEGKARVAQNGLKHGIYSDLVVLGNEDPDLYNEWRANHLAEWAPATETEYNLVIDIVDARWRLRRLTVLETKALDFEVDRMRPEVDEVFSKIDEGTRTVLGFNSLLTLNRTYEVIQTSIRSQHRIIERATNQLVKLGRLRRLPDGDGPAPTLADPASTDPELMEVSAEKSQEQTRETTPVSLTQTENRRSKPEPVAVGPVRCTLVVIDPTTKSRGANCHAGAAAA